MLQTFPEILYIYYSFTLNHLFCSHFLVLAGKNDAHLLDTTNTEEIQASVSIKNTISVKYHHYGIHTTLQSKLCF